jgi:hypothetical protein
MSLTKENLLSLLKSNVLALRDKAEELATNPQFKKAWKQEVSLINESVAKLSPEDSKWVNDEYAKWTETELLESTNNLLDNHLRKKKDIE